MKIAFIHTDFRIYWPARLQALYSFLQKKGIDMEVIEIAGAGSPYAFAGNTKHNALPWHILFPTQKMEELKSKDIRTKLYELLNQIYPDILISGAIAFPSGALSVAWAMKHKKKVICFDDAKMEAVKRSGLVNFIKQQIYNGVYAMLYPAPDWMETGKFWGFKPEQLFYGIDVVDNSFWQNYTRQTITDKKCFLAVGRQIPKKNFYHIVTSYKKYHDRYLQEAIPLILVGEGPEHERIKQFADENHLKDSVTLLPFKSQEKLKEIYYLSDSLILSSSSSETWGLVINEAMACGLPVIASDQCGATHTLVRDGVNGYVFSLTDENDLFRKMCMYHELSPSEKESMRSQAIETIKEWGLPHFCQGCYEAIQYVSKQKIKRLSRFNTLVIKLWKGRYRPV